MKKRPLSENKVEQVEHLVSQTMRDEDALYMIIRDAQGEVMLVNQKPALNRYDAAGRIFLPPEQVEIASANYEKITGRKVEDLNWLQGCTQ